MTAHVSGPSIGDGRGRQDAGSDRAASTVSGNSSGPEPPACGDVHERDASPPGEASPRAEAPPRPPTLWQLVREVAQEIPGLLSDRVTLLALELKRARQSLVQMVALAFVAAILVATAWLGFWIGLAFALLMIGLPGWLVFLLILGLNLGAAWLAVRRAGQLAHFLTLPATLRRLTVAPAVSGVGAAPGRVPGVAGSAPGPANPPDLSRSEPKANRDENAAVR